MAISTVDLAKARETAGRILDALQLDAFIYQVEPRGDVWELTVECACNVDRTWETVTMELPGAALLESFDSGKARAQLLKYCNERLASCKRRDA